MEVQLGNFPASWLPEGIEPWRDGWQSWQVAGEGLEKFVVLKLYKPLDAATTGAWWIWWVEGLTFQSLPSFHPHWLPKSGVKKKNPINFTPLTHHWLPNLVEGEIPQFQQLKGSFSPHGFRRHFIIAGTIRNMSSISRFFFNHHGIYLHMISIIYIDIYIYL